MSSETHNQEPADLFRHVLVAMFAVLGLIMYVRLNTQPKIDLDAHAKAMLADINIALGMKFRKIPAGTFNMGTARPVSDRIEDLTLHHVTISNDFYMATTELTQKQWRLVMNSSPWSKHREDEALHVGDQVAAAHLSWHDAQEYCAEINAKFGEDGWVVRLPTEAEWEYCCQADSAVEYGTVTSGPSLGDYAWFQGNAADINENFSHEVAKKRPNAWGLYDMLGNVQEWCQDKYGVYPDFAIDPQGSKVGTHRVFRGGGWSVPADWCRAAYRGWSNPEFRGGELGFRLVLAPG